MTLLLHVGFGKTGTRTLRAFFQQHPQILYAHDAFRTGIRFKQLMASSNYKLRAMAVTDETIGTFEYESQASWHKWQPDYYDNRVLGNRAALLAFLHNVFPNAKVLVVTRGFKSHVRSGLSQHVKEGSAETLQELLAERMPQILDYNRLIGDLFEHFGHERVTVLPFELLRDDMPRFLAMVEDIAGVDHMDIRPPHRNQSLPPASLYWYPRLAKAVFAPPVRLMKARGTWLYQFYRLLARRNVLGMPFALLSAITGKREMRDIPDSYIHEHYFGQATLLRDDPRLHDLYQPYFADYLLDDRADVVANE